MDNPTSKPSATTSTEYSEAELRQITLPVPTDNGAEMQVYQIDNSVPVHQNGDFLKGLFLMIAATAGVDRLPSLQQCMLIEAFKRNKIYPIEAEQAFWKAYSDPYLPKTGIEFRHLFKHIEKARYGEEGKLFTYEKMLDYCDKNGCSTDTFAIVREETDSQGRPKWVLK